MFQRSDELARGSVQGILEAGAVLGCCWVGSGNWRAAESIRMDFENMASRKSIAKDQSDTVGKERLRRASSSVRILQTRNKSQNIQENGRSKSIVDFPFSNGLRQISCGDDRHGPRQANINAPVVSRDQAAHPILEDRVRNKSLDPIFEKKSV